MAATQCIQAGTSGQGGLLKFKLIITTEKTDDLRNFECGIVDGSKHASQSISETADLLGFLPHEYLSGLQKIVGKIQ